jgi:polyferredoxin
MIKWKLPFTVFLFTATLLVFLQIKMENPVILAERFWQGAGWLEILFISAYAGFVAFKMQDPKLVPVWRIRIWTVFTIAFFLQLGIGLLGFENFLMTGKLHLPIPMMILAGPIYRGQISFMPILLLSTIVLTGPAWCSQLCYFGAFDGLASKGKTKKGNIRNKGTIKISILFIVVITTVILRTFQIPLIMATLVAASFGLIGLGIMIWLSRKNHKMIHCTMYCPIGTIVNVTRFVSPFRMYIDNSCDLCMRCTAHCKYDALNPDHIKNKKPGFGCTLCGDCLQACKSDSIKYRFLRLTPTASRNLYLFLTISLHAVFLAVARI